MIFAVDVDAAGRALRAGRCAAQPVPERCGRGRPRALVGYATPAGDSIELTPDRGLCRACTVSHVIVPAWYVPRRAYTVEVIGEALVAAAVERVPRAVLAERLRVPVDTIKDWLRRARHAATGLIRHALLITPYAGGDRPDPRVRGDARTAALEALGDSAAAFARSAVSASAQPPVPGGTGIDYLRLIAAQHHREQCWTLHIVDLCQAMASLPPWHIANLLTAKRRLLTQHRVTATPGHRSSRPAPRTRAGDGRSAARLALGPGSPTADAATVAKSRPTSPRSPRRRPRPATR